MSATENLKLVAVKFDKSTTAQESQLMNYINKELAARKVVMDDADTPDKTQRKDFRVRFRDMWIECTTEASTKVTAQKLKAFLYDLSLGGCSFGVNPTTPLTKGGGVEVTLSFLTPPLVMHGVILGLKKE